MSHCAVMPLMLTQSYCTTTEMLRISKNRNCLYQFCQKHNENDQKMAILNYSLTSLSQHQEKVQTVISLSYIRRSLAEVIHD